MKKLILALFCAATALGCDEQSGEKQAGFSGATRQSSGFASIEDRMCGEDVIDRPDGWDERKACAEEGGIYVAYEDADRKPSCKKFPQATKFQCNATSYLQRLEAVSQRDVELTKLLLSSQDRESEFKKWLDSQKKVVADLEERSRNSDEFMLNCYEWERETELGIETVIAYDAFFPNRRTTNSNLKCAMYTNFVHDMGCYGGLRKVSGNAGLRLQSKADGKDDGDGGEISKTEKADKDSLISGSAIDKAYDQRFGADGCFSTEGMLSIQ